MSGDSTAILDPRQAIVSATVHTRGTLLYTEPVLDAAAALLADVWAAAERHGVAPADMDVAHRCLEAIERRNRTGVPQTVEAAEALLALVVEELAALDVATSVDTETGLVLIPRTASTPTWGYDREYERPPQVGVTVAIDALLGGWELALNLRGAKVVSVAAPCDRAGAAAVARLAIRVNEGRHGNPFRW